MDKGLIKTAVELRKLAKKHFIEDDVEEDEFILHSECQKRQELLDWLSGDIHNIHSWIRLLLFSLKYNHEFKDARQLTADIVIFLTAILKHRETIDEWLEETNIIENELSESIREWIAKNTNL
jgi:hypothetical protein